VSCRVDETITLDTLNDPSGLYPVQNPQTSVCCEVEETKTFGTLHDPSGLHPVWNLQTSVSCEVEETKTLQTLQDPSGLPTPGSEPTNFLEQGSRRNQKPRGFT
jgi:hypothetical protein